MNDPQTTPIYNADLARWAQERHIDVSAVDAIWWQAGYDAAQARIRELETAKARLMSDYITEQRKGERLERENARLTDALKAIHAHTEPHDRPGLAAGLHLATVRDVRAMANSHKETKG